MKRITINTTQNVAIDYELASVRDRFLAWLIDQIIIYGLIFLLVLSFERFMNSETESFFIFFVFIPIFLFYTLLFETFNNGQTIGKRALAIKVVRLNGKHPELLDFIIRWAFRMVDIYLTAGSLAAIYVNSTERAQRIGGLVSNTIIVRTRSTKNIALDKLLTLETRENYELSYPKVNQFFNEKDMIVIKRVLDRFAKAPNKAHQKAIIDTCKRVKEVMGINEEVGPRKFLVTVLKDYIVLSR